MLKKTKITPIKSFDEFSNDFKTMDPNVIHVTDSSVIVLQSTRLATEFWIVGTESFYENNIKLIEITGHLRANNDASRIIYYSIEGKKIQEQYELLLEEDNPIATTAAQQFFFLMK